MELKPERVKPYLKMITEAVIVTSANSGTLRKAIWDYLMKKYKNDVDYSEFLYAIRRFINEGKVTNKEGFYSVHPDVILEVKERNTPISALKKGAFLKSFANTSAKKNLFHKGGSSAKKSRNSSMSSIDSPRQSKISKYFTRKQMDPFGMSNFELFTSQAKV